MTEILTESFCERCGTRYTFESSAPRQKRLRGIKTLGRGLKNFVMSDDSSLDEALAAARSDSERESTSMQLDAFHRTFNFCMSCRQYTCGNCWNGPEARCLSCSPMAVAAPEALVDEIDPARLLRFMAPTPDAAVSSEPAWSDRPVPGELVVVGDEEAPHVHSWVVAPGAAPEVVPGMEAATEVSEAEVSEAAAAAVPSPEPEAVAITHDEPDAAASIGGLAPGQSLEDAIAEYEASLSVPEPSFADSRTVEPAAEPVAALAAAEPEPEPVAALAAAEPEPEPERIDIVEQPTWATFAEPDATPAGPTAGVGEPDATPAPTPAPVWPTGPRWPTAVPSREAPIPTPTAASPFVTATARQATDAMWAASSHDVVHPPAAPQAPNTGVQPCISCGISLSANARFCRRCGTQQG